MYDRPGETRITWEIECPMSVILIEADIELTNQSSYRPHDVSLNGFHNRQFALVNLACDESVLLRATLLRSCASATSSSSRAAGPEPAAGHPFC